MRWISVFAVVTATMLTLGSAAPASAQKIPNGRFSSTRFHPAPGAGNYLMLDGTTVGGHLTPSLGLFVDYAHRPFVLFDASCNGDGKSCSVKDSQVNIVSYQLTLSPMATLSLWRRLQLGLVLPLVATDGDSYARLTQGLTDKYVDIRGGKAFGLGDPRLSAKLRLFGRGNEGVSGAAVGFFTAPLGDLSAKGRGIGDTTVTGGGHFVLEYAFTRLRLGANLGGVVRPTRKLLSTEVGSEYTYGVGGSFDATPLLRLIGEVTGATHLTRELDQNPIESRVAAELTDGDVAVLLGAGVGLLSGVGVPNFRVVAAVNYRPAGIDSDGDGVRDQIDKCPSEPEDRDGFEDEDGCPDVDNDNDGILDANDKCPNAAEDPDGFEDSDGCPDLDNDHDGIKDGYDSCPNEPEDMDGDRDDDGCPDDDRDRDGVPDAVDKCPDVPEDTDGFGDEDGCPETDYDGDGIPDDQDQCPDQPETKNGFEDDDGCPDAAPNVLPPAPPPMPTAVHVTCEKIEIPGKIYFKSNSDVIENRSHGLLGEVADAMNKATFITKLRVEGHTDDSGDDTKNMKLSERRAASVMAYLVKVGVEASRLESEGFGETQPIVSNKTKVGREANRRVEFVIAERSGQCTD